MPTLPRNDGAGGGRVSVEHFFAGVVRLDTRIGGLKFRIDAVRTGRKASLARFRLFSADVMIAAKALMIAILGFFGPKTGLFC